MLWIWTLLAAIGALAGLRHLKRMSSIRASGQPPTVDDEALRRILETGSLAADEDEGDRLDMDAAARAEEEFWNEPWDEPEEYHP